MREIRTLPTLASLASGWGADSALGLLHHVPLALDDAQRGCGSYPRVSGRSTDWRGVDVSHLGSSGPRKALRPSTPGMLDSLA